MARQYGKRRSRGMRNLKSAGGSAAKIAGRTAENAAVKIGRWVTTDHSGLPSALNNMPEMGFVDSIKYALRQLLRAIARIFVMGILIFIFISFGIPLLIRILF